MRRRRTVSSPFNKSEVEHDALAKAIRVAALCIVRNGFRRWYPDDNLLSNGVFSNKPLLLLLFGLKPIDLAGAARPRLQEAETRPPRSNGHQKMPAHGGLKDFWEENT